MSSPRAGGGGRPRPQRGPGGGSGRVGLGMRWAMHTQPAWHKRAAEPCGAAPPTTSHQPHSMPLPLALPTTTATTSLPKGRLQQQASGKSAGWAALLVAGPPGPRGPGQAQARALPAVARASSGARRQSSCPLHARAPAGRRGGWVGRLGLEEGRARAGGAKGGGVRGSFASCAKWLAAMHHCDGAPHPVRTAHLPGVRQSPCRLCKQWHHHHANAQLVHGLLLGTMPMPIDTYITCRRLHSLHVTW